MIDTRALFSQIIDEIDSKEADYLEEINNLDDKKTLDDYLTTLDDKVHDIYSLLDFSNGLKSNMDRILFERFCFLVFGNEEDTTTFFQELKNLSLLKRTGLMKYQNDQEIYSRQIMSNFLLKLDQFRIDVRENNITYDYYDTQQKMKRLKKYKLYFSPIGIVHEVEDAKEFNQFLEDLDIPKKDKFQLLLSAFEFNQMSHENEMKKYLPDLPTAKKLIQFRSYVPKDVADKFSSIKDVNNLSKKKKEEKIEPKEVESDDEFSFVDFNSDDMEEKYKKATEDLKEHSSEDPYKLFNRYYDALFNKEDNKDAEWITKAQQYMDSHMHLIDNLNDIAREDLEQTIKIYENDEDLREEVYKTTQYIDRLITYELKNIFTKIDSNDSENIPLLIKKVKPCMEYVEKIEKNNNKK